MAIFGKKKNEEDIQPNDEFAGEMKVILEAKAEEQEAKDIRAREREEEQEKAKAEVRLAEEHAAKAADSIINADGVDSGRFYLLVDEMPLREPENAENIVIAGNLRGKIEVGEDIYVYHGTRKYNTVKVARIINESRSSIEEAQNERVELEVTRGDFPAPSTPDAGAAKPFGRFSVLTNSAPQTVTSDRAKAVIENPQLLGMTFEYSRFAKDQEFFGIMMNALIRSSFLVPAQVSDDTANPDRKRVGFAGIKDKKNPELIVLPVFTDLKTLDRARKAGFKFSGDGNYTALTMNFARTAAVSRDQLHSGFVINPFGPVVISIPKKLIEDLIKTRLFKDTYGEAAASSVGMESLSPEKATVGPLAGNPQNVRKFVVSQPELAGEFKFIAGTIKKFGDSHPDVSRIAAFVTAPEDKPSEKAYVCVIDCPENKVDELFPVLASALKPFMRTINAVQFQLYSRGRFSENFFENHPWIYNKLER
ncbi:MAG: SseB family protein [Saccharofermentans sp.]|jgi:hypothetical protein|nr:SseB family protein [Mageeibacillus sp.]MCI1264180.1 SseB family protein [Saccharofermentans sp.]MCI1274599.1 SseB family protein [Saccharofermentans sp.]MCI1768704.1 SseB family protein [Mageeibacillus sp.]